jgi:hypothetical protein
LLPDGGTAWFFNDSFWGNISSDGTRPLFENSTPRNMVVIQHGTTMTSIGGPPNPYLNPLNLPGTLVGGPAPYSDQSRYNLTGGDGMMVGNTLYKFYSVQDSQGGNSAYPDWPVANALATFTWDGSTLTLAATQLLGFPQNGVQWGIALLNVGGYTYVYGDEDVASPMAKYLHLARVPRGQFTNWAAWRFWTGTTWSSAYTDSARLMNWVSDGFSVANINGVYVLVTADLSRLGPNGPFPAVAYYAATPWGFSASSPKYTIYVPPQQSGIVQYEYRIQPQFSSGSHLLISYSTNTLNIDSACMSQNQYDARIYRPRFVDVQLANIPGPSGQRTTINAPWPTPYPATPPVPPGAETWLVTDPNPGSYSSTHCSYSSPAAAPAPAVTAAATNADSSITMVWSEQPTAMWLYNVQYHDDTADPYWNNPPATDQNCRQQPNQPPLGGWCQTPYLLEGITNMTLRYLNPYHQYEVRVQANPWRANAGTWSATQTVHT